MTKALPQIWIDADACPKVIKEVVFKVATREKIITTLVANARMEIPLNPFVKFVLVKSGADMADHYIVEHAAPSDIVVTADIPLAAFIVEKGATAINIRGEIYTEENISERLSIRDFMKELRDGGVVTDGPAPFGPKDREQFTNALHKILIKKMK